MNPSTRNVKRNTLTSVVAHVSCNNTIITHLLIPYLDDHSVTAAVQTKPKVSGVGQWIGHRWKCKWLHQQQALSVFEKLEGKAVGRRLGIISYSQQEKTFYFSLSGSIVPLHWIGTKWSSSTAMLWSKRFFDDCYDRIATGWLEEEVKWWEFYRKTDDLRWHSSDTFLFYYSLSWYMSMIINSLMITLWLRWRTITFGSSQ